MCQKTRTVQRYLCGHTEENVDLDLCEDYEQLGECPQPPEAWDNKGPVNFGSKRVKSKCAACKAEENKSKQNARANTKGGEPSTQSQ